MRIENALYALLILAGFAFLGYFAYQLVGYLGLFILGLFGVNILTNIDLQRGGAVGSTQAADIYARQMSAINDATRRDQAERRNEMQQSQFPRRVAKIASFGLIVVGLGMFVAGQIA